MKMPDIWIVCKYIMDPQIIPPHLSGLFVLVEVGELQCAMNVYIFAASTSESCSTWVSTINQAKVNVLNVCLCTVKYNVCFIIVHMNEIKNNLTSPI